MKGEIFCCLKVLYPILYYKKSRGLQDTLFELLHRLIIFNGVCVLEISQIIDEAKFAIVKLFNTISHQSSFFIYSSH